MSVAIDVEHYFVTVASGRYAGLFQHEVNLLSRAASADLTRKLRCHPAVEQLDGLLLDDANTSNHHMLLRREPLAGQILYLAHDDDSRVVFSSLKEFLTHAELAQSQGVTLPELHPIAAPLPTDQTHLAMLIRRLVAEGQIDVVLMLVASLDLSDQGLLADLVAHDDFFLGEAVANAISVRPSQVLFSIAAQCAQHKHPQVARAGRLACEACSR